MLEFELFCLGLIMGMFIGAALYKAGADSGEAEPAARDALK